jgi:hypothetical protein
MKILLISTHLTYPKSSVGNSNDSQRKCIYVAAKFELIMKGCVYQWLRQAACWQKHTQTTNPVQYTFQFHTILFLQVFNGLNRFPAVMYVTQSFTQHIIFADAAQRLWLHPYKRGNMVLGNSLLQIWMFQNKFFIAPNR